MKRMLTRLALLFIPMMLTACMGSEQFAACSKSGSVCIEGVTTGSNVDGRKITGWVMSTPQGASYAQETSTPLGGELAKIAVASVVPAVINAGAGIAIADKQSCGGNGCGGGTQINVAGAQAQSGSTSVAENDSHVTVTTGSLCANQPGGVCRAGVGM